MLVVDSTVWIDCFNGVKSVYPAYLHNMVDQQPILVGDWILVQELQGFGNEIDFDQAWRAPGEYLQAEMDNPALVGFQRASNNRRLQHKGIPVQKTIDSLIVTVCIENEHELLHSHNHFDSHEAHPGLNEIH